MHRVNLAISPALAHSSRLTCISTTSAASWAFCARAAAIGGQSVGCHADNVNGEHARNGERLSNRVRHFGTASDCGTYSVDGLGICLAWLIGRPENERLRDDMRKCLIEQAIPLALST